MDALIAYFAGIPSSHRALILAGGIALFWLWETAEPLVGPTIGRGATRW